MKVYARSLLVGLCAAAVVVVGCWRFGLIQGDVHTHTHTAVGVASVAGLALA